MLDTFTIDTFAGREGDTFTIREGDATLPTTLTTATATATATGEPVGDVRRVPFSLVFLGPPGVVLPQRIYRMEHDGIGAFDVFLVTIGPDGTGMRYEAVFG